MLACPEGKDHPTDLVVGGKVEGMGSCISSLRNAVTKLVSMRLFKKLIY